MPPSQGNNRPSGGRIIAPSSNIGPRNNIFSSNRPNPSTSNSASQGASANREPGGAGPFVFSLGGLGRNEPPQRAMRPRRAKADPALIKTMMDMGFSKSQCKASLKQNGNNFDRALDKLLNNGDQYIGVENSDDSDGEEGGPGDGLRDREERDLQMQIQASLRLEEENKQPHPHEVIGARRGAGGGNNLSRPSFGDNDGADGQIG